MSHPKAKEVQLYGLFSAQAARLFGYSTYSTPDGHHVQVTCVTPYNSLVKASKDYRWPDTEFLGPVTEWISRDSEGTYQRDGYFDYPGLSRYDFY